MTGAQATFCHSRSSGLHPIGRLHALASDLSIRGTSPADTPRLVEHAFARPPSIVDGQHGPVARFASALPQVGASAHLCLRESRTLRLPLRTEIGNDMQRKPGIPRGRLQISMPGRSLKVQRTDLCLPGEAATMPWNRRRAPRYFSGFPGTSSACKAMCRERNACPEVHSICPQNMPTSDTRLRVLQEWHQAPDAKSMCAAFGQSSSDCHRHYTMNERHLHVRSLKRCLSRETPRKPSEDAGCTTDMPHGRRREKVRRPGHQQHITHLISA